MAISVAQKVGDFFATYPKHTYPKGQIIIQAGSTPKGVFYLLEGQINQYDIAASGNQVIVNSFKPGAFFPMSWTINNTPNRYFYEAGIATTAHVAPQQDVLGFLHKNPDVTFDLLARVYRGTDGVLRRLAHLMGGNARSRLLFELINAAYRFGTTTSKGIAVNLTENDIARRSGLSRETVSRICRELKEKGLIIVADRTIVVLGIQRLEALLGDEL